MRHVLVVDDDFLSRSLLERLIPLCCPDTHVRTAAHGAEALLMFRTFGADLVITDQIMPIMDGIELIRAIRHQDAAVPVLLLSGTEAAPERVAQLNVTAVIAKPFDFLAFEQFLRAVWNPVI